METKQPLVCTFSLNYAEGTSNKYYTAELKGRTVISHFGRTHSTGQKIAKTFTTETEAAKEFFKLARDKMRKGYRIREANIEAPSNHALPRHYRWRGEYGGVNRERAEISVKDGARMIENLTRPEPDEELLYESMFADGDAELISQLARTHPIVETSDTAMMGAWLAGAKD